MSSPPSHRALARRPVLAGAALVFTLAAGCGSSQEPVATSAAPSPAESSAPAGPSSPSASPSPSAPSRDSGEGNGASMEPAEEVVITISDFSFEVPDSVPAGATITVVNEDSVFHTVTADDGAFDRAAPGGESVTFTAPEEPGEYAFHCTPHPNMTATLVVR